MNAVKVYSSEVLLSTVPSRHCSSIIGLNHPAVRLFRSATLGLKSKQSNAICPAASVPMLEETPACAVDPQVGRARNLS